MKICLEKSFSFSDVKFSEQVQYTKLYSEVTCHVDENQLARQQKLGKWRLGNVFSTLRVLKDDNHQTLMNIANQKQYRVKYGDNSS